MRKVFKLNYIFIFTMLVAYQTNASSRYSINSKSALCMAINEPGFFQQKLIFDSKSKLAFRNLPGPVGRGICWWHSRFTRAANYLVVFRPEISEKPTRAQAARIIKHIRKSDQLVEIPGYSNLYDFSQDHKDLIAMELNRWSIMDSLTFKLVNGMKGRSVVRPKVLEKLMDELYQQVVHQGRVVFQTLQLPGISAHSWLVVGMEPTQDGYQLAVVDSNYFEVRKWNYRRGQTHFWYSFTEFLPIVGNFVPYANSDWREEEDKIIELVRNSCH